LELRLLDVYRSVVLVKTFRLAPLAISINGVEHIAGLAPDESTPAMSMQ
jgi:hypothetical protein